ncbi:hypothetical protein QOT17_012276 [Balamuthia mandrillaris]
MAGRHSGEYYSNHMYPVIQEPYNEKLPLLSPESDGRDANTGKNKLWRLLRGVDWLSPLLTVGVVTGVATQTVSLPLWLKTFDAKSGGPYFVLIFCSFVFAVGFGLHTGIWKLIGYGRNTPAFRTYWWMLILNGVFNGLNGLLLVYASPENRTPPLLQPLLVNTGILWSMICTRIFIGKKDGALPYLRWEPILALVLVVSGIMLSLSPTIHAVVEGKQKLMQHDGGLMWAFIFMLAVAPGAIANVVQEKFLKTRARKVEETGEDRNRSYDMLVMLWWGSVFQFLTLAFCWWMDTIPHYGFSETPKDVYINLGNSFKCFFGVSDGCEQCWWHGVIFIAGFFCTYYCAAGLNESSANYNLIATTLGSPAAAFFWIIFPSLTNSEKTPLWSVLPALFLLMVGSFLWKWWENRERAKMAAAQKTVGEELSINI